MTKDGETTREGTGLVSFTRVPTPGQGSDRLSLISSVPSLRRVTSFPVTSVRYALRSLRSLSFFACHVIPALRHLPFPLHPIPSLLLTFGSARAGMGVKSEPKEG